MSWADGADDQGLGHGNATEQALARHMMDWFAATNRAIPEQSMVERRIARLWREAGRP